MLIVDSCLRRSDIVYICLMYFYVLFLFGLCDLKKQNTFFVPSGLIPMSNVCAVNNVSAF